MPSSASPPNAAAEAVITEDVDPESLYDLANKLGEGGSGCTVYKAVHRDTKEVVAVKIVPCGISDEEMAGVTKEIELLAKCRHPNIVTFKRCHRWRGVLWVVMECCVGGSVDRFFPALHQPLPEQLIAYICHEILVGLNFLHDRKVLHRDIKGSNVLLTEHGGVKIADFGVSASVMNTLSRRNSSVGTLHWMSPESIQEKDYDARTDIWSLGITVIEMAEGQPPHFHFQQMRAMFEIPKQPAPELHDKAAWTPQLHRFLARCVVKDHTRRARAAELLNDDFIRGAKDCAAELADYIRVAAEKEKAAAARGAADASAVVAGDDDSDDGSIVIGDGSGGSMGAGGAGRGGPGQRATAGSAVGSSDDDDDGGDDTLVQRPNAVAKAIPGRATERSAIPAGMLVDMPVVSLDEMTIDELTGDDGSPKASLVQKIFGPQASDEAAQTMPRLTHTTEVLAQCMHHHRTASRQRVLTPAEAAAHERRLLKYAHIVRSSLGV